MKTKICIFLSIILTFFIITACSNSPELLEEDSSIENVLTENIESEENTEIEENIEIQENSEKEEDSEAEEVNNDPSIEIIENLTFEILSEYSYTFSSGAGGWGEEFVIERDGYFKGEYYDSDMGAYADEHPYGIFYSSNYNGYFHNLKKINEYSYEMTMKEINYKEVPGTEEIKDGILYVYSDSYCLGGTDTFKVYLPGTPLDIFSEDILIWICRHNKSDTVLTMIIIVDEENSYGIYSSERLSALEDATMNYNKYKESYDYYTELASEAYSTVEMLDNAMHRYEIADTCLNYLWDIVRYELEEEEFNKLQEEQRNWIKEKERKAQSVYDEWGGGSGASVAYYDILADMTMERCEELLDYIK